MMNKLYKSKEKINIKNEDFDLESDEEEKQDIPSMRSRSNNN